MTNERAIQLLHRLQDEQFDGIHGDERREALEMAVRALESNLVKESDGLVKDLVKDCISRQAAIVVFENSGLDDDSKDTVVRVLEQLPSAQPQRKTGKWIWWYEETFTEYATEYTPHCKCSECGRECAPSVATSSNFCRNCGADMRGESDE